MATVHSSVGPTPGEAPIRSGAGSATRPEPQPEVASMLVVDDLGEPTTVVPGAGAVELAVAVSGALFERAPVVVLAPDGDDDAQARAAEAAEREGAPLLLTPAPPGAAGTGATVEAELERLGAEAVLAVGAGPAEWARALPAGPRVVAADEGGGDGLPRVRRADDPLDDLLVLVGGAGDPAARAASATARSSGADVLAVAGSGDPRADGAAIEALAAEPPGRVLAVGDRFGAPDRLRRRLDVATTGVQLPGGGQLLYPHRRMTALYGHPGAPVLGVLGEQPLAASIDRAKQLAASYEGVVPETVVPAFEIIATVASSAPGPDGNYANESTVDELRPWVDAAGEAGVYVVLDVQPGRTDFLTQARRYEELLARPHVGLALDPEWRLGPGQLHMAQIGSVGAAEVNAVAAWLADLTRRHVLPQKLLLLHQFQTRMITDRHLVDTGHDELAVLVHADGFGTHAEKHATWGRLQADPPPGLWWGWKNFHDEDRPMMTPAETAAIRPAVYFVSYQ
jgi:hypothetical protein